MSFIRFYWVLQRTVSRRSLVSLIVTVTCIEVDSFLKQVGQAVGYLMLKLAILIIIEIVLLIIDNPFNNATICIFHNSLYQQVFQVLFSKSSLSTFFQIFVNFEHDNYISIHCTLMRTNKYHFITVLCSHFFE